MTKIQSYTWTRSNNGMIAGICQSIADSLQIGVWVVRALWLFSIFFLGTGFLVYIVLWICLPSVSDPDLGLNKKIFGVCARIGRRGDMPVGLARTIATTLFLFSAGSVVVGYIVLYFLIPEVKSQS